MIETRFGSDKYERKHLFTVHNKVYCKYSKYILLYLYYIYTYTYIVNICIRGGTNLQLQKPTNINFKLGEGKVKG